jgi:Lrp/AsnC family transcriptional regulator, leucine-responsive regulatory protein
VTLQAGLDAIDRQILSELQEDGRLALRELARRIHMSAPSTSARLRRLEETGVIKGYRAVVDPVAVGLSLLAFVRLTARGAACEHVTRFAQEEPSVLECHRLTGEDCFLLKIAVIDMQQLEVIVNRVSMLATPVTSLVLSSPVTQAPVVPPN